MELEFARLRRFDAFSKPLEDFRVKTCGGAIVTAVSGVLMMFLFVSELRYYLSKEIRSELYVDPSRGQKLRIEVDLEFPHLPCMLLSVDVMDVSGEEQTDVLNNLERTHLRPFNQKQETFSTTANVDNNEAEIIPTLDPNRCESCYGAETEEIQCCNTCQAVREAYRQRRWALRDLETVAQCRREGYVTTVNEQKSWGCRITGHLLVNKISGNFHFAPGRSHDRSHVHVHDVDTLGITTLNTSHRIYHLSFGSSFPGAVFPLDNTSAVAEADSMMFQYFIKVVPTVFVDLEGQVVHTSQFSVTRHSRSVSTSEVIPITQHNRDGLPGVFVLYEPSAIVVRLTETRRGFMHFLTSVCAIIGGVFTVAGLLDSCLYHSVRSLQHKLELGKVS
uniref:endoplasmic reticulum-Golgi intermediate compartment protein 3-like n=1 Tax=Myxine glutinosa TaxID=7769 RepID=UPI00358E3C49